MLLYFFGLQPNSELWWLFVLRFLDHTQLGRDPLGRTPSTEWPACRRGRYIKHTKDRKLQKLIGIRNRCHTNETDAELHFKPVSYRDRRSHIAFSQKICADTLRQSKKKIIELNKIRVIQRKTLASIDWNLLVLISDINGITIYLITVTVVH
jgi:hypothetical protein